jgi:putative flippase GtrA
MRISKELIRFAVVGAVSNLSLYCLYLVLTGLDVGHKLSMSLLYMIGVIQTYGFNKQWTFNDQRSSKKIFLIYLLVNFGLYLINLISMMFLVDFLHYPHQLVQAGMIVLIAGIFFLIQKTILFKKTEAT